MTSSTSTRHKKTLKWLKAGAWIVGISLLLFVGLFFFTEWLQNRLEKRVQEQSNGLYKLVLHELRVSPFIGTLTVDSLALVPDYKRWQELQKAGRKTPRMLFNVKMGSIEATGINMFGILFGNPVEVGQVNLQHPSLLITGMRPDTTERAKEAYQTARGLLKNITINSIVVDSARLRYRENHKRDVMVLSVPVFTLRVHDFKLDSQAYYAPDRAYYAKKIRLEASDVVYKPKGGQYDAKAGSLVIDTEKQLLLVKHLRLVPLATARQMSSAKGKAVTSNTMKVSQVKVEGLNYHAYSADNRLLARYVDIQEPDLEVYKDRKTGQPEARKPLPHELVRSIKTAFSVDTIKIRNGRVRYTELAPGAQTKGHITFSSLDGTISDFTNIAEQISMEKPAVVKASALMMGKIPLHITLRMPLLNKNGYHTLSGSVGEGNPEVLNAILVPTAFIRIESGYINGGEFKAELTENRAAGSMTIRYRNLEIEMLNKGSGGKQGLGLEILSELADVALIKDSNPMEGEDLRTGKITVTRNPRKSVINYWKDCLASGLLSSIGLEKRAKK